MSSQTALPPPPVASTHANPVLPGFYPDPSIVRVGDDYYLVNSTFQYFPAIVISHSKDLVNWRQIGHVFTRPEDLDLSGFFDGCGVWAPDISHHDGHFYIFYCLVQLTPDRSVNVRGNYMVKSRHVLGPYSPPVQLTTEGNDPSHFIDDDGAHYLLYAAGIPRGKGVKIARLNHECTQLAGPSHWLEFEPEKRAPEGPHLLRKDGFYYLSMAAGDGVYRGHHQVVARSRALLGPYEPSPHPPFIVERTPDANFYHHGHAKLVDDIQGNWWCVYLMRRRIKGFSQLGRETALDQVAWLEDGWPVLNRGEGPSDRPSVAVKPPMIDDFNADTLDIGWYFLRRPLPNFYNLAARPGYLRLLGGSAGLDSRSGVGAILRREPAHRYSAGVRLEFRPRPEEEAGLICYYDTENHLKLVVTDVAGPRLRLNAMMRGFPSLLADIPLDGPDRVELRVEVDGLDRAFYHRADGKEWREIASLHGCQFLSDEGTSQWGFTGTMVGLYARRAPSDEELKADFSSFSLKENPRL